MHLASTSSEICYWLPDTLDIFLEVAMRDDVQLNSQSSLLEKPKTKDTIPEFLLTLPIAFMLLLVRRCLTHERHGACGRTALRAAGDPL